MNSEKKEYILGTGPEELARLAVQHRIWSDVAVGSWKKAGVGPGSKVLDVGCGPGYVALDLAQLVADTGEVVAIDESESFTQFLSARAHALNLSQIKVQMADVQSFNFSQEYFDFAYCRWVLCWLKQPEKALQAIRKVIKKNGRLIIHDYFNWKTMTLGPRSQAVDAMIAAAIKSFELSGADIDVGAKLPRLLREAGFILEHFEAHPRVARGGGMDSTIAWPITWWRVYGPKLVNMGLLSEDLNERAQSDLSELEKNEETFFFCPTVFEFIARAT